jgi:hypothetical protein
MLKKSLWIAVGFLAIALFVFAGCEKQAKSGDQTMKTGSKCSMAGKAADANSTKSCAKMDKKACPKDCKKPCCAKKDAKCKMADVNEPNAPAKKIK